MKIYFATGITISMDNQNVAVDEDHGSIEICIDLDIGTFERHITVYIQTSAITGKTT